MKRRDQACLAAVVFGIVVCALSTQAGSLDPEGVQSELVNKALPPMALFESGPTMGLFDSPVLFDPVARFSAFLEANEDRNDRAMSPHSTEITCPDFRIVSQNKGKLSASKPSGSP